MRKQLLACLLLFAFSSFAQNNLSGSHKGSVYTYVYRINLAEARKLYRPGMENISEAYLHTLVDSFRTREPLLAAGNYLFVKADGNRLRFDLRATGNVSYKLINNNRDLVVVLHTKEGDLLTNASVSVNGRKLGFDAPTQTYRRDKYTKSGLLLVEANNVLYAFPLGKNRGYQLPFFKRLLLPLRKLFAKNNRRRYNDFHNRTAHEQNFKGFLVCNKPRYKMGDTVRLKAFVAGKKGTPLAEKLLLRLSNRYFDIDSILALVSPYRAGAYDYSFVLTDSLDLDLDEDYTLTLEKEGSRRYNLEDYDGDLDDDEYAAKREVVMRGRFYFEEYELDAITFSARSEQELHSRGEEIAIYLKASDENEMAVMDGRVQIIVMPSAYSFKTFTAPTVFLPDTLWQHEQPLEALGETKIILPDSIFPKAGFPYQVECVFLNSNNERQVRTLSQTFRDNPVRVEFELQGDSLHVKRLVKGVSQPAAATLFGFTGKGDTLDTRPVRLPITVRVNPFVNRYQLKTGTLEEEYEVKSSGLVSAQAARTKDSVFIRLHNPSQLPVWYTVFAGNKVLFRGRGDTLLYAEKSRSANNYFLSLQYIFNNEVHNQDYTVPYHDKLLSVKFTQPAAVYPGQTATVSLMVNDAEGRPVADADVTAWSFTRKFEKATAPSLPYFGKLYPGRRRYATFRQENEKAFSNSLKLAWQRWSQEMSLDTIEYYKFLHPQTVYVNTEPAPDSLTQVAPFVVQSGDLIPVHQLYIDERPVFFSASQHLQRYSFAVSPGRHSLRLRTHNSTIWLDSIEVAKGMKTFLSINGDAANSRIRIQLMKPQLTPYEKGLWSKYMLLLHNNFGENYAYVNNGQQVFFLPQLYGGSQWIGPLPNGYAELVVKNRFSQTFEAEGGYQYFISKGLIKQKQLPNSSSFHSYLSPDTKPVNFHNVVLTEKEVDSLWQEFLYNCSASVELFTNASLSQNGNGSLLVEVPNDSAGNLLFIRHIFLFRYNEPDYLRVYPGARRDLGYVQPGKYRLLFLLKNDAYFIADSIMVKRDGLNFYRIPLADIKRPDSTSRRISAIISEKERDRYGYSDADFNSIKESFNRQYFDASQLTETVLGIVRDEKGNPVSGAMVMLKGTNVGTTTNQFGQYSLRVVPNGVLVVNTIGYASQEVRVNDAVQYNFTLRAMANLLQEVVVSVGYGGARQRSLTGAVSSVTGNELTGKVAGIMIRGANSVDGSATPLLIVDGLPFSGKVEDLDPGLIASTNVLKGDAAMAVYGSQAAGGAIIITTKGAKAAVQATTADVPFMPASSLRQNFSDYAYWQPRLRTNAEGKASFTVTYPDDITAWRTFALVMTENRQSGFAEALVRSYKTISGNLSLPQFAIAGDTLAAIGKSLNYFMDSIEARRSFFINGALAKETLLRFRNSWIDTFAVVAPVGDSLKLRYTLQKADGYFDGEERSLPVFRPGVLQTDGLFAALRKDTSFILQPLSDTGTIKIYAEASVLPALEKEVESLRNYEYLCNEQLASKLKALLVQKRIDSFLKRPFRYDKHVRELIGKLSQNKATSGLWGWWKEGSPALWISLHVMEALVQATAQGYQAPLNKTALADYLVLNLESYRGTEKLSALHLLHLLGAKADFKRYTDSLQKDLVKMSLHEKLRFALVKQEAGLEYTVDSLLGKQGATMFGNIYWGDEGYRFFDNSIQNTLLMYRLLRKRGGHEDLLEKARGYFFEKRRTGYWRNTYESSMILETILPDVMENDSLPKRATLHLEGGVRQTVTNLPFSTEVKAGHSITIRKEGGLPVYFTAFRQQWNERPERVAGDFAVMSWFEKGGRTITQLRAGEPVVMKIAVKVKADASYVMVEAPIPAGCSYNNKLQSYTNNEVHREHFKHKVSIFCSSLPKGDYTFTVSLLPRYSGRYTLNPAKVEMMYFPVFYGREEIKKVRID